MRGRESPVSDEEARALWRRATELQEEAARAEGREAVSLPSGVQDLSVEQVLKVADEAGISRDHVLLAIAERRLVDAEELQQNRSIPGWARLLVEDVDGVEISRPIRASVGTVVEALEEVTSTDEFRMLLEDRVGEGEAEETVLVYRRAASSSLFGASSFHGSMEVSDGRVVLAIVRPDGEGSRLRLRLPSYEKGVNLAISGGSAGLFGAGGTAGGLALGELLAGLTGISLVAGPAVVGALVGGGVGIWAFRSLQRWGYRRGEAALERLVRVIATRAEGPPERRLPSRGPAMRPPP